MAMTISQLLRSTARVDGYGAENTFSSKQFGEVYSYNKMVKTKPKHSIIEVTMMIKGATERVNQKKTGSRTVAAHKVMVAISGVEQEVVSAQRLVAMMRASNEEYSDIEKYTEDELLRRAVDPDKQPFEGKTVMEQGNGEYVIITNEIKDTSYIQVWCSCSSYYWVFQYYNIGADVNIKRPGAPIKMEAYRYKTKKGFEDFKRGRPMRNPNKAPGVCKHIMLLLAMLMDKKVVSSTTKSTKEVVSNYKLNVKRFKDISRISKEEYDKLMKDYSRDRARKVEERKLFSAGLASMAQSQRKFYNNDFLKRMK